MPRGKFGFYGYASSKPGAKRFATMMRGYAKRNGFGKVQLKVRKVKKGIHRGEFEVAIKRRR